VAAIGERALPALGVPYWRVPDSRLAWAVLTAAWHNFPARQLIMFGVTGTDGKTSTAHLLHWILAQAGIEAGMVTSVSARIGTQDVDTGFHVTTPDAMQVQSYLAKMVEAGQTHCVLEVTSHGLEQHRVAACEFDIGVLTNITHEHLDYHGSFEDYLRAKARLFHDVANSRRKSSGPEKTAVLNRDDPAYASMRRAAAGARIVTFGVESGGDYRAQHFRITEDGSRFSLIGPATATSVFCRLPGAFNGQNCLAAFVAAVEGSGVDPETAREALSNPPTIPGRMEDIDVGQSFRAIVDFAHTPNALRSALAAARQMTQGKLIAVFGAAGERDQEKRAQMGEIAALAADYTIVTAEDPRSESLHAIMAEILSGAERAGGVEGESVWREPDRGQALRRAVDMTEPGDVVIALGKGHEQSMCFKDTEYPWDDRRALRAAIAERLDVPGPKMPSLPTS
jgi:UDP-N-acetylmuramoyl-L-alanyl-D-glutamate--2,6-diaminopimelate ligase